MADQTPYLSDNVLAEIAGRLRFGGKPLEQKIEEMSAPKPAPWEYPTHPSDRTAAMFGLRGFEFAALQQEAMSQLANNEMLREAYRRFLMIAKLTCADGLEKVRKHEQHVSEEKMKRDRTYIAKKTAYDSRVVSLTRSWTEVRSTIQTRWRRMGKSVVAMLEKNGSINSMTDRDRVFIEEMVDRGVAAIDRSDGCVVHFNWEKFTDFSIEDINEVVLMLDEHLSGGFIRKPVKTPFNDL